MIYINPHEIATEYPYLAELFSLYFSEPYREEETIAECINNFFKDEPSRVRRPNKFYSNNRQVFKNILSDLNKLIQKSHSEEELSKIIIALGMHLGIEGDGWQPTSHTYQQWIVDLRDILQEEYDRRLKQNLFTQ